MRPTNRNFSAQPWRLAAIAAIAIALSIGQAPASAADTDFLVGVWRTRVTKDHDPSVATEFDVLVDLWKDEKGELFGFFDAAGTIRLIGEVKLDGENLSFKILNPGSEPESVSGTVHEKEATLAFKEGPGRAKAVTFKFRWESHKKGKGIADADLNGVYAGTYVEDFIDPQAKKSFPVEVEIAVGEEKAGGTITLKGEKKTILMMRRSMNRVYFEWKDEMIKVGRFLGTIEGGKLVGDFYANEGFGDVTLERKAK